MTGTDNLLDAETFPPPELRFMSPRDLPPVERFRDEYRFLSNFYPASIKTADGREWPSVEYAYQAAKTSDLAEQERIRKLPRPGQAKRAGRHVAIREDWDRIKLRVMFDLLSRKFRQNPDLADRLRATGRRELIEGNHWHDTYWGVCDGRGLNHLGQLLMMVRADLPTP